MESPGLNLGDLLIQYLCLLFSLCVHEAAHALMANRCGDPSARLMGRATLNPLAHIDMLGTVILPLVAMTTRFPFLFGWAKPVPFNPRNLKNIRRDPALIAAAGPLANLALAITFAVLMRLVVVVSGLVPNADVSSALFMITMSMVLTNLALMLFNLIPVPPLDGGHVLHAVLPPEGQRILESIGPFGIIIAIVVARQVLPGPFSFLYSMVLKIAFWGQV